LSKRFAERLLQSFQKLSGRLGTLSCSSAADSARKGFDFSQAVGFGLAAANDVAKRMMVRTIRRGRSPRGAASMPTARFVDYIGATDILF
jgi:hypothetical protein